MGKGNYQPNAPGTLVPTNVLWITDRGGIPEQVTHPAKGFVPQDLPPKLESVGVIGRVQEVLLAATNAVSRLDERVASLPTPAPLIKALHRREAQRSSTIENTVATIEEVALLEAGSTSQRDEVVEARNNVSAIEAAVNSSLPPSGRWLKEIHRILLAGTADETKNTPGEYRTHQNWIGRQSLGFPSGSRYIPPPPGLELERCMTEFERAMNEPIISPRGRTGTGWPWPVWLAFVHYQFEAIHPFRDGNGRVGRALINALPCKWGETRHPVTQVSDYFADHNEAYYDALLRVSTHADWEGWIALFCTAIARQAASDLQRARCLADLREGYIGALRSRRDSVKLMHVIDELFEHPVTNATLTAHRQQVTFKTAQAYLRRLEAVGFVSTRQIAGLGKVYRARPVLQALENSLDDLPKPPPRSITT